MTNRGARSGAPLLSGLADAAAAAVLAAAVGRDVAPRTMMFRQGEPAVRMYLLRSGRVKLVRVAADGREILMRRLVPGECFGIASLMAGPACYASTAQSLDAAGVYVWESDAILAAANAHPVLAQNALRIVLRYLDEYIDRHLALLSRTAEQRLARTLTHLAAADGRVQPAGVEVDITNHDLGALADVGMFTVTRQLKRWERDGHLLKRRQKVFLRHPEALLSE